MLFRSHVQSGIKIKLLWLKRRAKIQRHFCRNKRNLKPVTIGEIAKKASDDAKKASDEAKKRADDAQKKAEEAERKKQVKY